MWLKVTLALLAFFFIGVPVLGFFSLRFLKDLAMAGLVLAGMFMLLFPFVLAFGAVACVGAVSRRA